MGRVVAANQESVFERRVRPIYDALDTRNYKGAIKLCDGLLDKYPKNQQVLGLKAFALIRQGKISDANKLADTIMATLPVEDAAVYVVRLILKDLHRPSDITRLHEAAHAQDPNNMEAAMALFFAYAREGLHSKQQQIGMKLLRASGGVEKQQWWIILTLMLQVRSATTAAAKQQAAEQDSSHEGTSAGASSSAKPSGSVLPAQQLLQLAESMAARQASKAGNKVESFEALLIWLDLLLAKGKPEAALELLQGETGKNVIAQEEERAALQADLLVATGDVAGAAAVLIDRVERNPDDWVAILRYLDCMLPRSASNSQGNQHASSLLCFDGSLASLMRPITSQSSTDPSTAASNQPGATSTASINEDDALQQCEAFISTLSDRPAAGDTNNACSPATRGDAKRMRGCLLAKVELAWRKCVLSQSSNSTDTSQGSDAQYQALGEAIVGYWETAGSLLCCAADVKPYTQHLPPQTAKWVWERLGGNSLFHIPATSVAWGTPANPSALHSRVSALQICADLGWPMVTESMGSKQAIVLAKRLMAVYTAPATQELYKGLDVRERGPADTIPTLAVGVLMQAACSCTCSSEAARLITCALVLLESAVVTRPHAISMRLALVALHGLLGNHRQAASHLQALDVKHIQLDSVASHQLLPVLLTFGPLEDMPQATSSGTASNTIKAGSPVLQRLLSDTAALFLDHERDAGDTLEAAYKKGCYTKVLEFVAFRERLAASATYAVVRTEAVASALRHAALHCTDSQPLATVLGTTIQDVLLGPGYQLKYGGIPWAVLPDALRFNQDLSTRPGWLPPVPGPPSLHTAIWWSSQRRAVGAAGNRHAWWHVPAAADASQHEDAIHVRNAQTDAVRSRWAQLHVLINSLQGLQACKVPEETGVATDVQKALSAVCQCAGWTNTDATTTIDTWLKDQLSSYTTGSFKVKGDELPRVLQLLTCAVLSAASSAAQMMTVFSQSQQSDTVNSTVNAATTALSVVAQYLQTATQAVKAELLCHCQTCSSSDSNAETNQQACYPCGITAWAIALLSEPATWLTAVLEAVFNSIKANKAKRKGGNAISEQILTQLSAGINQTAELCHKQLAELAGHLSDIKTRVTTYGKAGGNALKTGLQTWQSVDVSELWSWQTDKGFQPASVLSQLTTAQTEIVTKLHALADRLAARCLQLCGSPA